MSEALSLAVIYGALLLLRIPLEKAGPFVLLVAMLSRIEDWAKGVLLVMFLLVLYGQGRKKSNSHEEI